MASSSAAHLECSKIVRVRYPSRQFASLQRAGSNTTRLSNLAPQQHLPPRNLRFAAISSPWWYEAPVLRCRRRPPFLSRILARAEMCTRCKSRRSDPTLHGFKGWLTAVQTQSWRAHPDHPHLAANPLFPNLMATASEWRGAAFSCIADSRWCLMVTLSALSAHTGLLFGCSLMPATKLPLEHAHWSFASKRQRDARCCTLRSSLPTIRGSKCNCRLMDC